MNRDTLHDYRPDPTFEIKSHLSTAVTESGDASVIDHMDSLAKGRGKLDTWDTEFSETELASVSAQIPYWEDTVPGAWAGLAVAEKRRHLRALPWASLIKVLKANCTRDFKDVVKVTEKLETTKLTVDEETIKNVQQNAKTTGINFGDDYKKTRLYVEAVYRLCPNWFYIKDYFHDDKEIELLDGSTQKPEGDLKKVMVAFVLYRNYYVNGMLLKLRTDPGKLTITHKMVGSIELNSDYDVTVGGADDVPAAYEFHRAFAAAWGVEACKLFDTNLYYRDWMTVIEQTMVPSTRQAEWSERRTDPSIQVQVLDFIGDIYSLVKIRRYTKSAEWAALAAATMRQVAVPGFSSSKDIPRFKRLELVDQIYRVQFCEPLLARLTDVRREWDESDEGKAMKKAGHVPKDPADMLHLLMEWDKDSVLRAMRIAYIELGAKLRDDEAAIREAHAGSYPWRQNDDWGAVIPVKAPWTLQGMVAFLERSSLLLSEAVLFANEAYNTQGSLWTVVGAQGGTLPENLSLEHFLQSFNEQVGDGLKELQEYLAEIEHIAGELQESRAEAAAAADALEKAQNALKEAGEIQESLDAAAAMLGIVETGEADAATQKLLQQKWDARFKAQVEFDDVIEKYRTKEVAVAAKADAVRMTGFYRASKYEGRMREMLQAIVDNLNADPAVRRRIEVMRLLFPGKNNPDSQDLMLLTKECLMAGFFDKYVQQLLLIRKGKDFYFDFQPREVKQRNWQIVHEQIKIREDLLAFYKSAKDHGETEKKRYEEFEKLHNSDLALLMSKVKHEVKGRSIDAVKDVVKTALADASFTAFRTNTERKVAEIIIAGQEPADGAVENPVKGLRLLIQYLLQHCAMVNQLYRKIRSRGPVDLYVRTFAE